MLQRRLTFFRNVICPLYVRVKTINFLQLIAINAAKSADLHAD